jgi:hypothetical protein
MMAPKPWMESLEIKAPINGIVFEVSAETGQTYQAEAVLFTIGDPKALEVVANVTRRLSIDFGWTTRKYISCRPEVTVQEDRTHYPQKD